MKYNNEANEDLSVMLYDEPENPVVNSCFFKDKKMDYSIESVQELDNYLESVRGTPLDGREIVKIVLRSGSYIGEVIRSKSACKINWLEYDEAIKISSYLQGEKKSLGCVHMLHSEIETFIFPMAKVLKRLENGEQDSVVSFVKVAISEF